MEIILLFWNKWLRGFLLRKCQCRVAARGVARTREDRKGGRLFVRRFSRSHLTISSLFSHTSGAEVFLLYNAKIYKESEYFYLHPSITFWEFGQPKEQQGHCPCWSFGSNISAEIKAAQAFTGSPTPSLISASACAVWWSLMIAQPHWRETSQLLGCSLVSLHIRCSRYEITL